MEKNGEKRRRIVNACAAFLSFFAVFASARLLTLAASALMKTDAPSLPAGVSAAIRAASLAVGCVLALVFVRPRPDAGEEKPEEATPRNPKKPAYLVPTAVFLLLAVNLLIYLSGSGKANIPSYTPNELAVRAVLGCTVYPIMEETFFRGVFLGALRERDDPLLLRLGAAFISAAAFAAVHTGEGFVFPFFAGIILAVPAPYGLTGGKRSLVPIPSVAAHALYNLTLYVSLAITAAGIEPVVPLLISAGVFAIVAGIMMLTGGKADGKRSDNKENNG